MECQCFHLILPLFTPHADGVIVVGSSTSGVPHSLTFHGLSDSVIICFSLLWYNRAWTPSVRCKLICHLYVKWLCLTLKTQCYRLVVLHIPPPMAGCLIGMCARTHVCTHTREHTSRMQLFSWGHYAALMKAVECSGFVFALVSMWMLCLRAQAAPPFMPEVSCVNEEQEVKMD